MRTTPCGARPPLRRILARASFSEFSLSLFRNLALPLARPVIRSLLHSSTYARLSRVPRCLASFFLFFPFFFFPIPIPRLAERTVPTLLSHDQGSSSTRTRVRSSLCIVHINRRPGSRRRGRSRIKRDVFAHFAVGGLDRDRAIFVAKVGGLWERVERFGVGREGA